MKNKKTIIILLCLVFALAMAAGVYAAVSYGSKDDPLITKSYLEEILRPEIEAEMEKEIEAALEGMESAETGVDFAPLTLAPGDKLDCGIGCEVLQRSGKLICAGAFVDTTTGADTPSGTQLEENHLYLASEDSSLTAETEATVLIKGAYAVN